MHFLTYLFFEFDFQSTAIAGGLDYLDLHNFVFAWLIAIFFPLVKIILLMVYFYYFLRLFYLLPVIIFYCRIYQNSFYKKLINIVRQKNTAVMLCFIPTWLILIVIGGGIYSYLTNLPDLEGPGPSSNYAEELLSSTSDLKPKGTQNETTKIGIQTEVHEMEEKWSSDAVPLDEALKSPNNNMVSYKPSIGSSSCALEQKPAEEQEIVIVSKMHDLNSALHKIRAEYPDIWNQVADKNGFTIEKVTYFALKESKLGNEANALFLLDTYNAVEKMAEKGNCSQRTVIEEIMTFNDEK